MKKIDYYWPRAAVNISGIMLLVQCVTELVATRKPEYEWVFWGTAALFVSSVLWSVIVMVYNARISK